MSRWIYRIFTTTFAVGILHFVSTNAIDNNSWTDSCCMQDDGCFVIVEGLIWKACRCGLDYAGNYQVDDTTGLSCAITDGRTYSMNFDWDVGVRAALGYRLDCDR